jgi:hypothetical protein
MLVRLLLKSLFAVGLNLYFYCICHIEMSVKLTK